MPPDASASALLRRAGHWRGFDPQHPDRDAQFSHLNDSVRAALALGEPVISVDTKKKELVGDVKNAAARGGLRAKPEEVRVHDFLIKELGRTVP